VLRSSTSAAARAAAARAAFALGLLLAAAGAAHIGRAAAAPGGAAGGTASEAPAPSVVPAPPATGISVLRLIDPSRRIRLSHGRSEQRTLSTYVRYPALGAPGTSDVLNAPPARAGGPFPLVVFAHGFAVTPAIYANLLRSWTRAGYVVAAPVFPLESANAPGGPDESDLVNEPRDISFVISRLLEASAASTGPLAGLIDPSHVALAGQSDGGEAALAAAYSRRFRDPRVTATVVLSGAEMSGVGGFRFAAGAPPLLAAQGTADRINEPKYTDAFFKAARRPKYLLRLLGSGHLPPYTRAGRVLEIVAGVSTAFLDGYLKSATSALQQLVSLGNVPGLATEVAAP
jgi:dienelactone hydrolase